MAIHKLNCYICGEQAVNAAQWRYLADECYLCLDHSVRYEHLIKSDGYCDHKVAIEEMVRYHREWQLTNA